MSRLGAARVDAELMLERLREKRIEATLGVVGTRDKRVYKCGNVHEWMRYLGDVNHDIDEIEGVLREDDKVCEWIEYLSEVSHDA